MSDAFPLRTIKDDLADAEAAERRAARTIGAARAGLPVEIADDQDLREIAEIVAERLAALPRERRMQIRRETVTGLQEMEGVVRLLEAQMQALSSQLKKAAAHAGAATAYTRNARR